MRFSSTLLAAFPVAQAANIIMANDDGWAEINIRTFYSALIAGGENKAVISAPAENKSGSGALKGTPSVLTEACEFNSCPSGSPATGANASNPDFNYVNSFPATAMAYGISTTGPDRFGESADLAVAGPNVGGNLGAVVFVSGTVGATTTAVKAGVPAIAFSGATGTATGFDVSPVPSYAQVYADLAANVTNTLLASGTPYLPPTVWLNVNFPASTSSSCSAPGDFKFVLSRIFSRTIVSGDDVTTCGNGGKLPSETTVVGTKGCYASVSVGSSNGYIDASEADQATVLTKLGSILSCLP